MTLEIWTPPAPARAANPQVARLLLDSLVTLAGRTWRGDDALVPGVVILAARAMSAGAPPLRTRPLRVSAAGWTVADPLALTRGSTLERAWWSYLTGLATHAVELDLVHTAARWVEEELAREGVQAWRDAPAARVEELERVASAAMAVVADGELHARKRGPAQSDFPDDHAAWADQGRVDLGRLGWRDALRAVQSGRFPPALV
ncbi:hypothetical protein, partial [Deinococcus pimensis]|uniref:hypothetical protein n=1 Tax=Deinococcus pimensis TaxID=309888 RepID=UPI0005EBE5C6